MKVNVKRWKCKSDKLLKEFTGLGKKSEMNKPYHFGMVNFQNGMDKGHPEYLNYSIEKRK